MPLTEEAFATRVDQVAAFRTEHGRMPRKTASAPQHEQSLASFLSALRREGDRARITAQRRQLLEARLPGWQVPSARSESSSAGFEARVAAVKHFHEAHGRWPQTTASGSRVNGYAESTLASWWYATRKSTTLSAEQRAYLDAQIPGWRPRPRRSFEQWASDYANWVTEHGSKPRLSGIGASDDEKALANWFANARRSTGGYRLTAQREAILERLIPGWRT